MKWLTARPRVRRWARRVVIGASLLVLGTVGAIAIAWHLSPFPLERLDRWPASPTVTDRTGGTLLTIVGVDKQWRFPITLEHVSPWLIQATIAVEDERFDRHAGVDPIAIVRALGQNVASFRTVSGASTLTMQVCRMMEDRPRSLWAKTSEAFRAVQLEHLRSKGEILATYLNIAPYGGNLRGVEAGARAWFGKRASDLSLGEAALLAGLPQSPSRLRPDRFPGAARSRRRHVLSRMVELGMITPEQARAGDQEAAYAGAAEGTARRDRDLAPHAAWLALQRRPAGGSTTIDPAIQGDIDRLARQHVRELPPGTQIATVVIDLASAEIVALVGSTNPREGVAGKVNGVLARRSPGSTLKPFVYAAAFEAGMLDETSVLEDEPIERAGWSPGNFDRTFSGKVTASDALQRSLNVPAILVAEGVGLSRCLGVIESAGVSLPRDTQARGGLAVVTGATEVTLLDLTNAYSTIGRGGVRSTPRLFLDEPMDSVCVLDAGVCALIDDILSSRRRRPRAMQDRHERDVPWFMWKTGTSSGRRDAWAVGHNGRFAIGVWIGRFSGAGSAEFVGAEAGEPLLAGLFDLPALRRRIDPPVPARRPAVRPLPAPIERADELCMLSPSTQARFVAIDGGAAIRPRANRGEKVTWFLNGRLIDASGVQRLFLPPGHYELRCVDAGQSAATVFDVVSTRQARTRTLSLGLE